MDTMEKVKKMHCQEIEYKFLDVQLQMHDTDDIQQKMHIYDEFWQDPLVQKYNTWNKAMQIPPKHQVILGLVRHSGKRIYYGSKLKIAPTLVKFRSKEEIQRIDKLHDLQEEQMENIKKVKGKSPPDKLKEYKHQDRLHYRLKKGKVKSIHPLLKDLKTQ